MKLAICIPAFNEEQTIGRVIEAIPREIPGVSLMKVFVVDDGSTDHTQKVATQTAVGLGREKYFLEIVEVKPNKGLANAFLTGIKKALSWGAEVIVNIDADGQYRSEEIGLLLEPILKSEADMAIGDRQVRRLEFMSPAKKYGNMVGSWFLRRLTGVHVRDASSGFRAYTRAAAKEIQVYSKHTYTHENLIQAHYLGLRIAEVPVTFISRPDGNSSRLIRGVLNHIFKSLKGIFAAWRRWRRNAKK